MASRFLDLSPMSKVGGLSSPVSDLVKHFDDLFSDDEEASLSPPGFKLPPPAFSLSPPGFSPLKLRLSPLPLDVESSDDSGLGSLDGTSISFLSDITNSNITSDFSALLDTSSLSSSCDKSSLSFLRESPLVKQLSFDSPASSPNCLPEPKDLKPRRMFFDDSFEISSSIGNISVEDCVASSAEQDSMCDSPTLCRKNKSRRHRQSPSQTTNSTLSVTEGETIKTALHKEDSSEDLIGDFSRAHSLSTLPGKHQDLKSITADTLAEILTGISPMDADYRIIDCRYPYEYVGGHIEGSLNFHTQDHIQALLEETAAENTILIFHCEFSSERGPKRARFLRSLDRQLNSDQYPKLNFPEIYILHGGYKEFYQQYPDLCTPEDYIPMLHPDYKDDLKKYRSSAKSWKASKKSLAAKIHKIPFKY